MPIDKEELNKLSPRERIKRLHQLEEEKKREATEIGELIKKSMQELKTDKLAGEIAPEQKAVDISRLFEADSGQRLEKTARRAAPAFMKGSKSYQAFVQTYNDYTQLRRFYGVISTGGTLTEDHLSSIGEIGERISKAERYMTEGEKSASKLDASRFVLYKLKKETGLD